jgi:hypothetical protein
MQGIESGRQKATNRKLQIVWNKQGNIKVMTFSTIHYERNSSQ